MAWVLSPEDSYSFCNAPRCPCLKQCLWHAFLSGRRVHTKADVGNACKGARYCGQAVKGLSLAMQEASGLAFSMMF